MKTAIKEPELQQEYELLRDNARGITNFSRGLCVFLQRGMIGWMRFLNYRLQEIPGPLSAYDAGPASMFHKQELASGMNGILADVLIFSNSQQ